MPQIKTAAMTPAKARALEALAGLVVGGGAGGFLATKTFQTKEPRYWLQNGQIYGRDLSKSEKQDFLKRLGKAAVMGGSGAAALSLGASAIRRKHLTARDARLSREAFQRIFKPLDIAIRKQKSNVSGSGARIKQLREAQGQVKGVGRSTEQLQVAHDLEQTLKGHREAEAVLERLRSQKKSHSFDLYLDRARKARKHVPWGGKAARDVPIGEKRVVKVPSRMTAEGQMSEVLGKDNVSYSFTPDGKRHVSGPGQAYWTGKARGGS